MVPKNKTSLKNLPITFIILLFAQFTAIAQDQSKYHGRGVFGLGGRSTISLFNEGRTDGVGTGAGGQFRIQFSDRVNTDWFFDYLTAQVGSKANRQDLHIGWSVLFYPYLKKNVNYMKVKPYFLAGHCFDYTNTKENTNPDNYAERWSSAIQGGIGTHFNLSERFDVSATAQYMTHLGTRVHSHEEPDGHVHIEKKNGVNLEGHLLLTISINYKIAKLW